MQRAWCMSYVAYQVALPIDMLSHWNGTGNLSGTLCTPASAHSATEEGQQRSAAGMPAASGESTSRRLRVSHAPAALPCACSGASACTCSCHTQACQHQRGFTQLPCRYIICLSAQEGPCRLR